jgi:hypothetical protein
MLPALKPFTDKETQILHIQPPFSFHDSSKLIRCETVCRWHDPPGDSA